MKQEKKRAMACVAGSVILQKALSQITDVKSSVEFDFDVSYDEQYIDLKSIDQKGYLFGDRNGREMTLYDFDTDELIRMVFSGQRFEAFDFETDTPFEGKVENNRVDLWDCKNEELYSYTV